MTMSRYLPYGTLLNVATVAVGSMIGLFLSQFFTSGMEEIIFQGLGLATILIGVKMALRLPDGYMLSCIFSLVLGGISGEAIHLDSGIAAVSEWFKNAAGQSDSTFSEGLITAFLLFCIGSMTIVGAIEEGISGNRDLLLIKSTLDGFSSVALAATLGIGVMFSIVPLLIFQGLLTLTAKRLQPLFDSKTIDLLSSVGGLLIIGIAINLLQLGTINLENLLPALVLSVVFAKTQQYIDSQSIKA